jgi:two-component system nitrate/nitrite sensor histidine kinase NarX
VTPIAKQADSPAPPHGGTYRNLGVNELFVPLIGLVLILIIIAGLGFGADRLPAHSKALLILQTFFVGSGIVLVAWSLRRIRNRLLAPLAQLREWAQQMRSGNLSAQISQSAHGEFAALAYDINKLGESLRSLSREMDERVNRQTITLQRKTRSLEILYDVAAQSNSAKDLDELLNRFLLTLTEIVYAHAGTVRLVTADHQMRLVGSVGLDDAILDKARLVPVERCLCAQDFSRNMILCQNRFANCPNLLGEHLFPSDRLENIAIPLRYKGRILGIYNLFVEKLGLTERADIKDILTNIGQHLSMAIEKAHWDEESKRMSIMQERTMLAHELHDSLAQTLASLRFRVSMLQQTLRQKDSTSAQDEAAQLKEGLDEANLELRELLAHFRVRMDERGLIPATESLVERFKDECDIHIFFQNECPNLKLPPVQEVHLLHIIQEALANIRKHSDAQNVRLLMRCQDQNHLHLLIEDDGMGMGDEITSSHPGEHVGLTIMQERATRIGATLNIESEPGEGTRIELELNDIDRQALFAGHPQVFPAE